MIEVKGYIYEAAEYCKECMLWQIGGTRAGLKFRDAEAFLDKLASVKRVNRRDEHSFDSDDFPKVILNLSTDEECDCIGCGDSF